MSSRAEASWGTGRGRGWQEGERRVLATAPGSPFLQAWFLMTSPETSPACQWPGVPACSAGWPTPLGKSQLMPAAPGECKATREGTRTQGRCRGHRVTEQPQSWGQPSLPALNTLGCPLAPAALPTALGHTHPHPPTAGVPWDAGSVRSGPAPGAVPWKVAPLSPRLTPGPTASTAHAPTSSCRWDTPAPGATPGSRQEGSHGVITRGPARRGRTGSSQGVPSGGVARGHHKGSHQEGSPQGSLPALCADHRPVRAPSSPTGAP